MEDASRFAGREVPRYCRGHEIVQRATRQTLLRLRSGWQFPLKTSQQPWTPCHPAMRNPLRTRLRATRKTPLPLLSIRPFPLKTSAPHRTPYYPAMRNPLRIGPRASRKMRLLGARQFPVKTAE